MPLNAAQPNRLPKWSEWLNEDLWQDVHGLIQRYHVFLSWNAILGVASEESRTPGTFHAWTTRNYLEALAVALRRLTDNRRGTVSLERLLMEVEQDAPQLTRDWYVGRAADYDREIAERWFANLAEPNGAHVDRGQPAADRRLMAEAVAAVKTYVDQHLAHLDSDRSSTGPTIGQAHAAVATIYRIYRKWFVVLTNSSVGPLMSPPWEGVFTVPWITTDDAVAIANRTAEEWRRLVPDTGSELD